jgi:hypothetical protein
MTKERVKQRTVYLVTAGLIACLVSGFALAASFATGGQNTVYQGSQHTTVNPSVPGLNYTSTNLTVVDVAPDAASSCSVSSAPCSVQTTGLTICVGGFSGSTGCASLDFIEQVNFTTVVGTEFAGTHHTVGLQLFVTGTPVGGSSTTVEATTVYFSETGAPSSQVTISLDFDIGTVSGGPGTVQYVTVVGNAL